MTDESQVQVTRKGGDSSLTLSSARSRLIARGRREAALLVVPCNKCGERKELVFAGCVCASCSDAIDKKWADARATDWVRTRWGYSRTSRQSAARATDWVLIVCPPAKPQANPQEVIDIMTALKQSLARARKNPDKAPRKIPPPLSRLSWLTGVSGEAELFGDGPTVYFYRDTTYAEMKSCWAKSDVLDGVELGGTGFLADFTEHERDAIDLYHTDQTPPFPTFIRPATSWEIERYNALDRDRQRHQESTKIFDKWGFDLSKGTPFDGIWDDDAERRGMQALEETRRRLEQLGLLEGSNYKHVVADATDLRDEAEIQRELLWGEIVRETVTILEKWGFGRRGRMSQG